MPIRQVQSCLGVAQTSTLKATSWLLPHRGKVSDTLMTPATVERPGVRPSHQERMDRHARRYRPPSAPATSRRSPRPYGPCEAGDGHITPRGHDEVAAEEGAAGATWQSGVCLWAEGRYGEHYPACYDDQQRNLEEAFVDSREHGTQRDRPDLSPRKEPRSEAPPR